MTQIRINQGRVEYEISEDSRLVRERHEKSMQELMMERRAAALAVPTDVKAVQARLRHLGEPITLFGEGEMESRDRLQMIMANLDAEGQLEKSTAKDKAYPFQPFHSEGSEPLKEARIDIAKYPLVRASLHLQRARRSRDDPDEDMDVEMNWALKQAESFSEIGDDWPLSGSSFSPDRKWLALCSLPGAAKLWSMPKLKKSSTLKGAKLWRISNINCTCCVPL